MNAVLLAIAAGIIAGLTILPGHVGPVWFILIAFAGVAVFLAVLAACALYPFHHDRDSTSTDPDEHMAPLRQPRDTVFPDWPTGEFALDMSRLGAGDPGDKS